MVNLSIIILSYNTRDITKNCLNALLASLSKSPKLSYEIITIDNGSNDGSVEMLETFKRSNVQTFKLIKNKNNFGYPKGNNQALKISQGEYILFINSDVIVDNVDFCELIDYLNKNEKIGVLTVKVNLSDGKIDPASHRGFPNLWNAFCYFFKLEQAFRQIPKLNIIFGGYHLTYKNINTVHEIDSPSGAFYLTCKRIIDKVGNFDESFFMYGEDLDLSYRIKKFGFKVIYYPLFSVTHLKYASGFRKNGTTQKQTRKYFYDAMKIFYKKHFASIHPVFLNNIVYMIIDWKSKI